MVYPTHGAGSLCSTGIASTSWSTIGYERRHDPLLAPMEIDAFARALLAGQPTFPRYFARMRPINQAGPRLLGGVVPEIAPLTGDGLDDALASRRARRRRAAARGARRAHVPGLAVDPGRVVVRDVARLGGRRRPPIVLIVEDPADLDDLARQALRIGFEAIVGHVDGGFEAWRRAGRPVEAGRPPRRSTTLAASLRRGRSRRAVRHRRPPAVRVRGRPRPGLAPHRRGRPAASVSSGCRATGRSRTICASGYRSSVAASLLRAAGFERRRGGRRRRPGLGGARLPGRLRRRHGRPRLADRREADARRTRTERRPAPRPALSRPGSRSARAPRRRAGPRRGR